MRIVNVESQINQANKAIKNTHAVQKVSEILLKKSPDRLDAFTADLRELDKIMEKVASITTKSMKGAKLAESRAKSRLMAVKKASAKTIKHTAKAKRAAIASRKATQAALVTFKKIKEENDLKKYQGIYKTQVKAAMRAAKESEKETSMALKSSKTARQAARMSLEPLKI